MLFLCPIFLPYEPFHHQCDYKVQSWDYAKNSANGKCLECAIGQAQGQGCLTTAVAWPLACWAVVNIICMSQLKDLWARMSIINGREAFKNNINIDNLMNISNISLTQKMNFGLLVPYEHLVPLVFSSSPMFIIFALFTLWMSKKPTSWVTNLLPMHNTN